jgi:LysR family transcriptional regulator, benzoate and cis,cis-muconate-responsive activator of ben and cat genes
MRLVLDERLVAALGPHTRWSRRAGLRSVAAEPFIIISSDRSASFYDHVLGVCAAAGFAPRIVQEASELFTVVSLVRAGLGVALVPRSTALMSSRRSLSRAGHSRSRLEYRARVA